MAVAPQIRTTMGLPIFPATGGRTASLNAPIPSFEPNVPVESEAKVMSSQRAIVALCQPGLSSQKITGETNDWADLEFGADGSLTDPCFLHETRGGAATER